MQRYNKKITYLSGAFISLGYPGKTSQNIPLFLTWEVIGKK